MTTTLKASTNYGRPMHANAMSKSPSISHPSTAAGVTSSTGTSIRRLECKSAMNSGTAASTWYRLTLVVEHEHAIRYGTVPGGRPDWVAFHAPTPPSSGESYPNSNRCALATRQSMGLAEKVSCLDSKSAPESARRVDALLLSTDHELNS